MKKLNEKIISIKESCNNDQEGFEIVTSKQKIFLGIDSGQSCCEQFGYFMTNDNIDEFVGSKLLEIKLTDTLLKVENFDKEYSGNIMFVNIETSKGTLQFVAYNDHNGYYSHEATIISTILNHSEYL
jgi:hypothetical protein